MQIIDVDLNGVSADGEDFSDVAAPEAVEAGYMVNTPVRLRYPDGSVREATRAEVTQRGLDQLMRDLPIAARDPQGNA